MKGNWTIEGADQVLLRAAEMLVTDSNRNEVPNEWKGTRFLTFPNAETDLINDDARMYSLVKLTHDGMLMSWLEGAYLFQQIPVAMIGYHRPRNPLEDKLTLNEYRRRRTNIIQILEHHEW